MKPRLLPDTRLLPSDRGVVISGPQRTAAFALPGIHPWLERLRPFLDGRSSLDQLTSDLPPQAAQHVRSLVELLAREGFVRDATADLPHGLSPQVRARHAALIDFIAARADSPEHRFERYRDCAPLVVGTGRMASALVLALLASGVAHVRLRLRTVEEGFGDPADVARLRECVALLQQEGGCFRYQQLSGNLSGLPADAGVVLLGSDVYEREPADEARALAIRAGVPYGQAVGRGAHIVISTVGDPGAAPEPPASCVPPGSGRDDPAAGAARAGDPARVREPSPYLGGPVAALAANQLCLHLLHRTAGLDNSGGGTAPSPVTDAEVLDLTTGRFLGAEPG
ncbi:hypothetical protein OG372_36195 [Streptomyces sp. NBC_01020]|uniref:hypothetical protein n=1 Tax=Streptomyces sp. NBC_01020 TaxID=2903722 RepID=UPI003865E28B|nr:hypothetical protein OG372_36195 [Streptomyces sp. NBC_01020]